MATHELNIPHLLPPPERSRNRRKMDDSSEHPVSCSVAANTAKEVDSYVDEKKREGNSNTFLVPPFPR